MTRSIAQAARDAVSGADETLWQACWDRLKIRPGTPPWTLSISEAEKIICTMSREEKALYDIEGETK